MPLNAYLKELVFRFNGFDYPVGRPGTYPETGTRLGDGLMVETVNLDFVAAEDAAESTLPIDVDGMTPPVFRELAFFSFENLPPVSGSWHF